jgi:hypothetical protein
MAYLCIIASVPRDRVDQIRVPADVPRLASRVSCASHFIAPGCAELREAMDGGTPLDTDTWHPLRGFMFHEPEAVQEQTSRLVAFAAHLADHGHQFFRDAWTQTEVAKVVDLFRHATAAGETVVTHLDLTRTGKKR